jgi:ABC-type nitrate/sulfonate/bicarbonate transport system substrate-binding protein
MDMRRKSMWMIVALMLAIVAATAPATGSRETDRDDETGQAGELTEVTLMLDWVANANHVGLFVARERGFFEAEGLDVTIVEPGEVWATSAVVGGQAEFGIDFQENITMLRADDVPLVSIAAIMQTNTSGFATRAEDGITSPAEFALMDYGTFNSPFEEPTLRSLVECAGGDASGIRYVTAGMDLLAMLQQRQADLVWIYYGTEGFQAQRLGIEIDYFPLNAYQDCIPDYYTPIVITSQTIIDSSPDLVRRFVGALVAAHEYVMANPQDAAQVLADSIGELDEEELEMSIPWLAEHMQMDAKVWGYQEAGVWADYADWLMQTGVLEKTVDTAAAFTNAFLPAR